MDEEQRFSQAVSFARRGDLRRAEEVLESITQLNSSHSLGWAWLGAIALQRQREDEATNFFRRAIDAADGRAKAGDALVLTTLGAFLLELEHFAGAVDCFTAFTVQKPADPVGHFHLAIAHHDAGDLGKAERSYLNAIDLTPGEPSLWNNLGVVQKALGRFADARASLLQSVQLRPGYVAALNNLGLLHYDLGELREAIECFQECLAGDDANPIAHNNLGLCHRRRGAIDVTLQHFERALQLDPQYIDALQNRGSALIECGQLETAQHCLESVLRADPRRGDAMIECGLIAAQRGDFSASEARYREALEQPSSRTSALYHLVQIGRPVTDVARQSLIAVADNEARLPNERVQACFALGADFDRGGDYESAWRFFELGNRLRSSDFDPAAHAESVNDIIEQFSEQFSDCTRAGSADEGTRLVFVVGMPRSGTTLVEQIIARHSRAVGCGEVARIGSLFKSFAADHETFWPEAARLLTPDALRKLASDYRSALGELPPKTQCAVDKTPANFLHIGGLLAMFPDCRIVHVRRDPWDTCVSCFFQNFAT
ncbi:MAG: tetratricopeptide repeat protein, partial [Pirellulaceae bacterium]|nr:tetratricopeptide repeat protein [Pirellulaceae bacterium]